MIITNAEDDHIRTATPSPKATLIEDHSVDPIFEDLSQKEATQTLGDFGSAQPDMESKPYKECEACCEMSINH